MQTKTVLNQEIDSALTRNYSLAVGRVQSFDSIRQRAEVLVERPDGNKRYAGLPWPSLGQGSRLGPPRDKQLVILGYVDGNPAAPIILGLLSGSGIGTEAQTDLSTSNTLGRLRFLQGLS